MRMCGRVFVWVCVHVCACVYMCVRVCVCVCVYVCVCVGVVGTCVRVRAQVLCTMSMITIH